jgi:hypothetical protein
MHIKFILKVLFFLILTFVATHVYFHPGFPYTHDGENHLARFASYKQAIREGQFPPRFAPNLFSRYGYPVFNYNYPLANILSLPFSFGHLNYEITFKILAIGAIFLGAGGTWEWLRVIGSQKKGRVVGVLFYIFSPYLFSTILFRGNIGEIFALGLLPWVFWGLEQVRIAEWDWKKIIFSISIWSAFLLSHNVTVVFTLPLLIVYLFARQLWRDKGGRRLLIIGLIGVGLTLWFWLPALAEKSFIVVDDANVNSQVLQHFPTLSQLLFAPLRFGFSQKGSIDGLSFGLGMAQVSSLFLGTILLAKYIFALTLKKISFEPYRRQRYYLLAVVVILCWILFIAQLSLIAPIWSVLLFIAKYLQFPWRLGIFWSIFIIPVTAFTFEELSKKWQLLFLLLIVWQAVGMYRVKPADFFHRTNEDYDYFTQSTSTNNENRARTFTYTFAGDWQPTAQIESGEGKIDVLVWKGSSRTYRSHLKSDSTIIEPTMNFPGWQTVVTNQVTGQKQIVNYISSPTIDGRIAYSLPAGDYLVKSVFTQWTWARIIGNTVSLISGFVLMCWLILIIMRKKHV